MLRSVTLCCEKLSAIVALSAVPMNLGALTSPKHVTFAGNCAFCSESIEYKSPVFANVFCDIQQLLPNNLTPFTLGEVEYDALIVSTENSKRICHVLAV